MELDTLLKIENNPKLHDYLIKNSYWFRYLNRDSDNYEKFYKSFKKYQREYNLEKMNKTIDNVDMITSVLKMMD